MLVTRISTPHLAISPAQTAPSAAHVHDLRAEQGLSAGQQIIVKLDTDCYKLTGACGRCGPEGALLLAQLHF